MKLGGFGRIGDCLNISEAGYDFAELDIPEMEALSESEYEKLCTMVENCKLSVLTGARLFPIVEPLFFTDGFNPAEFIPYLEKACKRTSMLGIQKIIFGNGKARSLGVPKDREKEPVFIEFLRTIAGIAQKYGQELILEPLGPKYSNYINTIPEAVNLIKKVNMPNVFTMADLRHIVGSKEPFDNLVDYISYIHHIHVDYPISHPERKYPRIDDGYNYTEFLAMLKKSGYNDTLTIEADIPDDWKSAYQQAIQVLGDVLCLD